MTDSRKRIVKMIAVVVIAIVFLVYIIHTSISLGMQISEKEKSIEELKVEVENQRERTDQLQRTLDQNIDTDYVEQVAHDKLGLIYPHERVFVSLDSN